MTQSWATSVCVRFFTCEEQEWLSYMYMTVSVKLGDTHEARGTEQALSKCYPLVL